MHGSTPGEILSYPRRVCFDPLPPFYQAVLSAWVAVDGGFSALGDTLVVASSTVRTPVSSVSTKSTNSLLLEFHRRKPACVRSFSHLVSVVLVRSWPPNDWCLVANCSWGLPDGAPPSLDFWDVSYPHRLFLKSLVGWDPWSFVLFSCPLAQAVLYWLQSLLLRCSALIPPLACRDVLFGFIRDELRVVPRGFECMLNVCKYFLWPARNDYRFRHIAPSSGTVCARVRFHLPLGFTCFRWSRRRRYFVRQWGARGVLASIVDGNLVVHLWVHCLLDAGFPRLSLASSFHHIARHQIRGVSPRALAFLPSGLCFSRLSFGLLWRCSIVPVFHECWPLRSCLALLFHQIARYQSPGVFPSFSIL